MLNKMTTKLKKNSKEDRLLAQKRTTEEIINSLSRCQTEFESEYVLKQADKDILTGGSQTSNPKDPAYKALTLFEFEKGVLLTSSLPERFRVFALDLSKKLQAEFDCQTPSEKATAELTSMNFIRTLNIQSRISAYLNLETISDMGIKYLAVLSKELDRANRHYLTSVQILKIMKQPQIEVNIKTQTAVIGQNQIVQSNNNDKAR